MIRRGISLLEMIVAGTLLVAMMTICLQMLGTTTAQHRAIENQQTAIQEAANLMERLSTRSWDELTPQGVKEVQLSEQARASLPGGELEIELTGPPDEPQAKRIAVLLRWKDRTGKFTRSVRLVAWKYRVVEMPE